MTAKSFLSMEEMMSQFSTLEKLVEDSYGHNPENWGLCQRGNQYYFGEERGGWVLQVSLYNLLIMAEQELGEFNTNQIVFFFGFTVGTNELEYNLYPFITTGDIFQPGPMIEISVYLS